MHSVTSDEVPIRISLRVRHIALGGGTIGFSSTCRTKSRPWKLYGPPRDCKHNRCHGWFGLRKCIRPVCGDKLLAIMESAHR
jgi:hypothetical protein